MNPLHNKSKKSLITTLQKKNPPPPQPNGSKLIKISRTDCRYEFEATNIDNVSFDISNLSLG